MTQELQYVRVTRVHLLRYLYIVYTYAYVASTTLHSTQRQGRIKDFTALVWLSLAWCGNVASRIISV